MRSTSVASSDRVAPSQWSDFSQEKGGNKKASCCTNRYMVHTWLERDGVRSQDTKSDNTAWSAENLKPHPYNNNHDIFFVKLTQDMNVKGRNPKFVFLASL
jgi:hypothetical protein